MSERCERTNKQTSEWPSIYVVVIVVVVDVVVVVVVIVIYVVVVVTYVVIGDAEEGSGGRGAN